VLRPVYDQLKGATASSASKSRPIWRWTPSHHRRGRAALEGRQAQEPDGQGAGDAGGPAGDRASDRRGHQHQHHAAVLAEGLSEVAEAYLAGLEKYVAGGGDPSHVASVASFFVSRIDSAVDKQLDEKIAAPTIRPKRSGSPR
jgi:hypothetical protein